MLNAHQQNGGIPVFNHVTSLRSADFTLQPAIEFIGSHTGSLTALCMFSGEQAVQFYQQMAPVQAERQMAIFVSPMMLEESLLQQLGSDYHIAGVKGYIPWHHTLPNENNRHFAEYYAAATGQAVNYFSLLGWDAGLLVNEIISLRASGINNIPELVKSLGPGQFNSPRGWMRFDTTTHQTYGPAWLAGFDAAMQIRILEEAEMNETRWRQFVENNSITGDSSSWRNTYLCI
jgi:branched-chain amino acid transport system substrate-binding protein